MVTQADINRLAVQINMKERMLQLCEFLGIKDYGLWHALLKEEAKWDDYWNNSDQTDLSIYNCPIYAVWNFVNHFQYTQQSVAKTLFALSKYNIEPVSFIDVGAGLGLATWELLVNLSPCTGIYWESSILQKEFADKFILKDLKRTYSIRNIEELPVKGGVDLVCAFEFFEHIKNPIEYFRMIIKKINPLWLSIANSFSPKKYGHYSKYEIPEDLITSSSNNNTVDRETMKEMFWAYVSSSGWELLDICKDSSWHRPRVWRRK